MMVDKINPTSQFHPYQPPDATPRSESTARGGLNGMLNGVLNKYGLDAKVGQARSYARSNPGLVLGSLTAAVIGAGLLRKRSAGPRSAGFR
jgi:hypothetical protein